MIISTHNYPYVTVCPSLQLVDQQIPLTVAAVLGTVNILFKIKSAVRNRNYTFGFGNNLLSRVRQIEEICFFVKISCLTHPTTDKIHFTYLGNLVNA